MEAYEKMKDDINCLKTRTSVLETRYENIMEDIKNMKAQMSKTMWFTIATLVGVVLNLAYIIVKGG